MIDPRLLEQMQMQSLVPPGVGPQMGQGLPPQGLPPQGMPRGGIPPQHPLMMGGQRPPMMGGGMGGPPPMRPPMQNGPAAMPNFGRPNRPMMGPMQPRHQLPY